MLRQSCQIAAIFCLLAGCGQSAKTTDGGSTKIATPVVAHSGDTIALNSGNNHATPSLTAALYFGLGSAAYNNEGPELAQSLSLQGDGLNAAEPYRIIGLKEREQTLQAVFSFIALQYPNREHLSSALMAGPGKTTLGQFTFQTEGGTRHLYFDLTEWAAAFPEDS